MACSCVSYGHTSTCLANTDSKCSCVKVCNCYSVCNCDYVCTEFTEFNSSNCGVYSNISGDNILNNGQYMTCAIEPAE